MPSLEKCWQWPCTWAGLCWDCPKRNAFPSTWVWWCRRHVLRADQMTTTKHGVKGKSRLVKKMIAGHQGQCVRKWWSRKRTRKLGGVTWLEHAWTKRPSPAHGFVSSWELIVTSVWPSSSNSERSCFQLHLSESYVAFLSGSETSKMTSSSSENHLHWQMRWSSSAQARQWRALDWGKWWWCF